MARLPAGVASTLQFLGPLTPALVKVRGPADPLWAALAGAPPALAVAFAALGHDGEAPRTDRSDRARRRTES
ncbi:hypothetical protein ACQEU6_04330 [Spirillospora sp. CA-108201]